ncbi:4Fe-4S dicluster domain-containing protein [Methanothermobacter wolfeii]|uniref:4Fe-4S dicluster domain-containing protein n=1 Tax=Methanothermobacter wolfeii TaxID=145261 RepID=UPI0024B39F0D|nr:4Fe-4S dicluster domain-containing protein [Methanothermobacter wolfeii]MDI6702928.1 4Fe-4S dicluster domain-containing protein [Methanothermobacter wolfeii]MDI6841454.1 4Fe-4S dicluster domain-containing protein [Methanothermobacter wolfeii]
MLMVLDPARCSGCDDCINACRNTHGTARAKKGNKMPVFCLQCHPEKAPCARICPVGAIREVEGALVIDEDACILCKLCMVACPVGMIVMDPEKRSAEKCTLCMDADCIIPACVDACKENVLKLISVDDLAELKDRLEFSDILEEAMKFYRKS